MERWGGGAGHRLVQVQVDHRQEGAAVRGLSSQFEAGFSFSFFCSCKSAVVIVGLLSPPLDRRQLEMCQTATTVDHGTINGGSLLA